MTMKNYFTSMTLTTLKNAHVVRVRPSLKDVERQFRNGSFTYTSDSGDKFFIYSFVHNFEQFLLQSIVRSAISS